MGFDNLQLLANISLMGFDNLQLLVARGGYHDATCPMLVHYASVLRLQCIRIVFPEAEMPWLVTRRDLKMSVGVESKMNVEKDDVVL
jgi:hypothetical protein